MANTPAFDLDAFGNTPMNCMTLIAGKAASATGHVLVGHNEDDGGHVVVRHGWVPPRDWEKGAVMPAEEGCALLPQVAHTLGYYWVEYRKDVMGLSNADGFVNERGVVIVSNSMGTSREGMENADCVKDGGVAFNLRRALAERALEPVVPGEDEFPYALRLVSEILSSNGSSSMASVCGSTLSLMDAGVPISDPVAGVAMGLIKEGDNFIVLTDILGDEDALGDMDFKIAGTAEGVTGVQMDIKITGLTTEIMRAAMKQAHEGRHHILEEMAKAIAAPRKELSRFAPQHAEVFVNPDIIRLIIGPGGKNIKAITAATGASVDIEDTGRVSIFAPTAEALEKAREMVSYYDQRPDLGGGGTCGGARCGEVCFQIGHVRITSWRPKPEKYP